MKTVVVHRRWNQNKARKKSVNEWTQFKLKSKRHASIIKKKTFVATPTLCVHWVLWVCRIISWHVYLLRIFFVYADHLIKFINFNWMSVLYSAAGSLCASCCVRVQHYTKEKNIMVHAATKYFSFIIIIFISIQIKNALIWWLERPMSETTYLTVEKCLLVTHETRAIKYQTHQWFLGNRKG